ncbi:MAG: META domain-containing protein [Pseudomonadota bacterium]
MGARGMIDNTRATMLFEQDGRLSGDSSCNGVFGSYQASGTTLQSTMPAPPSALPPSGLD